MKAAIVPAHVLEVGICPEELRRTESFHA